MKFKFLRRIAIKVSTAPLPYSVDESCKNHICTPKKEWKKIKKKMRHVDGEVMTLEYSKIIMEKKKKKSKTSV